MSVISHRLNLDLESEDGRYLVTCARLRNVAVTSLVNRLVKTILKDQLVLAILDDGGRPEHHKSERKFRELGTQA